MGAKYWYVYFFVSWYQACNEALTMRRYNPGAFHNGFKGLCSVFVTAAFSFSGTEMVGLCAAETANPRKTLPKAVKQVFWRILLVS